MQKILYVTDPELEIAAEVAFQLGQPLLLTGEPGTGKTTFARHVAEVLAPRWIANLSETTAPIEPLTLYTFSTKSTSNAVDLFYRFDHLRRFHASHDKAGTMSADNRDYISFEALGRAILHTLPWDILSDILPGHMKNDFNSPQRSVVLIDEIDKAPRDFPNDILLEIERKRFEILELQTPSGRTQVVEENPIFSPIIILTSNNERNLPAAFLRRCVYHHICFPERDRKSHLEKVIQTNLTGSYGQLESEATEIFYQVREQNNQDKKPAIAELIQWIKALHMCAKNQQLKENPRIQQLELVARSATYGALVKSQDDKQRLAKIVEDFIQRSES